MPGNQHKPDLFVKGKTGFSRGFGILTPMWPRAWWGGRGASQTEMGGTPYPDVPIPQLVIRLPSGE